MERVIFIKAEDSVITVAVLVSNIIVIRASKVDSVIALAAGHGIVTGFLADVDTIVAVFADNGISSS